MADEEVGKPRPRRSRAKIKKSEEALLSDDVSSSNSQLKLDEMLQKVVQESTKNAIELKKKKKKKPKNEDEEIVLESLRKGEGLEGLHKEQDSAIIANIYDPDNNIKNEKSNKQRQKRRDKSKSNIKSDDETSKTKDNAESVSGQGNSEKKKKKKVKSIDQSKVIESLEKSSEVPKEENKEPVVKPRRKKVKSPSRETTVDDESLEAEEEKVTNEEVTEASTSVTKKKKKKSKEKENVPVNEDKDEEKPTEPEEEQSEKKKKKKKKTKIKEPEVETENAENAETEEEAPEVQDHGDCMAISIHRTDKLRTDFRILHPVIRVHVINEETGDYIEKQHIDRAVTSYYETCNDSVKTILPMMTRPFDFKQRRSVIPVWDEMLVFNENFNYFVQPKPKVILFFELLDFVSMNTASKQFSSQKEEGGWHRIAWAFLKVCGKNGEINSGNKQLRLQLYTPLSKSKRVPGQPEVYHWWQSGQRIPYPSTLYVTLKSITNPEEVPGAARSMFATQKEMTNVSYKELKSMNWSNRDRTQDGARTMTTWTRMFGQLCRIPNSLSLTLTTGKKGCYIVKFSHDGRSLACACGDGRDYPILIYEIPTGALKGQFNGHFGIVYSLSWSKHDTQIISASSDGTVRIWKIHNFDEPQAKLLPHPGFVYTAEFHPRVDSIVVTGGYDEVIRVWDISISDEGGMLQQEMEQHHGHINSICFDTDNGQKMYSADSVGTIIIWNVFVTEQISRKHFVRDWTKFQDLKDAELKDTSISHIEMHPSGRRLLVHSRNNAIFLFDLRVQRVMQKYFGAENLKEKIYSTITPCGSFVMSGSEDGKVYAWNTDTGDQVAVYTQLNYQNPVTDVHYHPRDHMAAFCALGENLPIYIYKYDPAVAQADAFSPRPMSPIERTDVEDLETARTGALKEADLLTARTKVMTKDEFHTQQLSRYQQIMKKMDSATMQMVQMPGMVVPENLLSSRMDTVGRSGIQSSWKMQYDTAYSLTPRSTSQPPGILSPHAPSGAGAHLASQISSQRGYLRSSDGDWRPTFSELGRQGRKSPNSSFIGRPPNLTLSTSLGKPQFTFESPLGKSTTQSKVIALYDYRSQRSDELTLFKGDVVQVLYKDNENWWMGELENGKQGFFPANYVTSDDDPSGKKQRTPSVSSSQTVTAVTTKTGELTFISDDEAPRKVKKGRKGSNASNEPSNVSTKPPKERRNSIDELLDQYESVA